MQDDNFVYFRFNVQHFIPKNSTLEIFWNRLIDIINNKLKCIQDADQTEIKQDYYLNKLIEAKEDEYIDQAVPSELHTIIDEDI